MSKLANHDPLVNIYVGDVLDGLRALPAESVQCCVTSPPYFGLRDYQTGKWEGGDPACDHIQPREQLGGMNSKQPTNAGSCTVQYLRQCRKCGAVRTDKQIGLEPTPDAYVARMVEVFREVRRVLRSDGVLLLNVGDSYASGGRKTRDPGQSTIHPAFESDAFKSGNLRPADPEGVKPKDLIGIPWLLAFALRADGWYLRQDIIWHKPNPMPESVTDRCTKAHEYLFLLAKSERYFWDAEAVKEQAQTAGKIDGFTGYQATAMNRPASGNQIPENGRSYIRPNARNRRSVWTITTRAFRGAHFATFPPDLVQPCIAAGSRPGDTVLDPFSGSGTTGAVARVMGRAYVGTELNHDYAAMWDARLADVQKWWDKRQGTKPKPKRASVKSMGESLLFNVA